MKKFMFTAIAMVAFMGSSMANTIEVEKACPEENIPEDDKGIYTYADVYLDALAYWDDMLDYEDYNMANYLAHQAYDDCNGGGGMLC
ncbi:hypothetical protein ACFPVY_17260 [Flavobacterium qiangtangense]|uniref:Uncharacterized protein n=1 Tax=Flavobacterium qiangtangense TaxID=1442595 RepID=A0ABW1PSL9_9FLAO